MLKSQLDADPDDTELPEVNILTRYVCPTVKAVAGVIVRLDEPVALTQLFEFAFRVATAHDDVLKICNRPTDLMLVPILLSLILGKLLVAVNEYHTSGEAELPQNVLILAVAVAEEEFRSVPAVLEHVNPGVRGVALPHASFEI